MAAWRSTQTLYREAVRAFLIAWIVLCVVVVTMLGALYRVRNEAEKSVVQAIEQQRVASALAEIRAEFRSISSDLLYLTDQTLLRDWLSRGDVATRSMLAREYTAFARHKWLYDQIRLIDDQGREIVRVDWNNGHPGAVPERALQYKGDRYYFRDAFVQGRGVVYVSPFDLNIERGRVERPLKPVIRFGTPVFDQAGHKRGLIMLNYLGQRLLDRLRAMGDRTSGHLWLLNADGYWLLGPRSEDEWGFMFSDRKPRFSLQHAQAWTAIANGKLHGQFDMNGALYSYASLTPVSLFNGPDAFRIGGERWIVVSYLPPGFMNSRNTWLDRSMPLTLFAVAALTAAIAAAIAHLRLRRARAEAAVNASEVRFRALLESAPDGLVITGDDGRIQLVNGQAERLFGYTRQELLGQPVELLMPERYRGRHTGHRAVFVGEPHARPMGQGMELCGLRKDGSEFPVAISLSPVQTDQGLLVVSDIRDATAQKQTEREIRDLNRRLEQHVGELQAINEELESFSYSVSHDLRAPLRAIDGFSRILLNSCADRLDEPGREHLGRIRRAAQHMGALIDDILKLSRVTRAGIKPELVVLGDVAREIVDELRRHEPERRVKVEIAPDLKAHGDARLLRIALENLLGNAWKFTARRDEALIEFGSQLREGRPVYYVRDNGAGFDMTYADKLFGAFQRLHDAREFPGTGIGLATVQRVIHKHGGQVWAEAAVDRGATFYFTLGPGEEA